MITFEIGNNLIKALWGKTTLKDIQISGMTIKPFETDLEGELTKIIYSIGNEKTIKKYKPIVLVVPRNQVTLRSLRFPAKDEKELADIVNLHLTQQVPYTREEIIYNYTILGKTPSGLTEVILGIVHRRILVKQFSVFEKLNLYPENVLLSTYCIMKLLRKLKVVKDNEMTLRGCLDIDDEHTDFIIFRGGNLLFSKSIPVGHSQLNADDRMIRFMGELKQAIAVFQTETRENLSRLYISGVPYNNTTLEDSIDKALYLPVEIVSPVSISPSLKEIKDLEKSLKKASVTALLGAALEPLSTKLNFVLPEAKLRKEVRTMARNLIVMGSIIVYLIVLVIIGLTGRLYNKQTYLNKLIKETTALEYANRDPMNALEKIRALKGFTRKSDSFLYYYYELSKIVPANITVERLIFSKKREFSMIGKGTDMGEIFKFVRTLNKTEIFGKAELRYSRKKTKEKSEFNEFEIMCHID